MIFKSVKHLFRLLTLWLSATVIVAQADELLLLSHDFPPYSYYKDGQYVGINTDIIVRVLEQENIPFIIESINWARAQQIVQSTPNTALLAAGRSKDREDKYAWVGPLVSSTPFLFKLSNRTDIVVDSLQDLELYRIALTRHGVMVPTFEKMGLTAPKNLVFVASARDTYRMLFQSRADFILGSDLTTPYNVRRLGYDLSVIEPVIKIDYEGTGNHLALNKNYSPDIIARANARIQMMRETGEIARITDRYRLQPKISEP